MCAHHSGAGAIAALRLVDAEVADTPASFRGRRRWDFVARNVLVCTRWSVCVGGWLTSGAHQCSWMPGWSGVERDLDLHRHRGGVAGRAGRGPVASPPSADQHCRKASSAGRGASNASPVSGWWLDQLLRWGRRSTGSPAGGGSAAAAHSGTGVRTGTAETACAGATCGTGVTRSRPATGFGARAVETPRAGTIQAGKAEAEAEAEEEASGARPANRSCPAAGCGACGSGQTATR
jgi:hypothetical protein